MRRLFKYLFRLALLLGVAFVGYAMFSDLPAPVRDTAVELPLPADARQAGQ